jgi:hypothetical protein
MSQAQQVGQDLQFVKSAVTRRERDLRMPAPIAWAVAIYVVIGYTMIDFAQPWSGPFFAIAGVLLGVVCGFLGRRESLRTGEYDRAEVRKGWLHWVSIPLAIAAVIALGVVRHVDGQTIGQFIVVSIGIIYFLGGVHFDRNLLWLGPVLMAGAIAITYVPRYGWTALGLVIALGLVVPTLLRSKNA